MFENEARPNMADPVGKALRGLASAVADEVAAPGGAQLRTRARATRRRRSMRISVGALSIAAAAAIAVALIVLGSSGGSQRSAITTPTVSSHSVLASHASTVGGVTFVSDNLNQIIARSRRMRVHSSTIRYPVVGANDDGIAFGADSTWLLEGTEPSGGSAKPLGSPNRSDCGALVRLGSSTMAASGTLSFKECPVALAFGDGSVWVLGMQIGTAGYRLTRVDPADMTVQASTVIDGGKGGVVPQGDTGVKYFFVTADDAAVTVAVQTAKGASQLVTLDAKTLATVASMTVPLTRGDATALAAGGGVTWLGTNGGWVYRIDSRTGQVASARQLGAWVHSLSVSRQGIWMTIALPAGKPASAYPRLDTLELNSNTGAVEHDTGLPLLLVASDGSDVWGIFATPRHGNYIAKIDSRTRTVAGAASSPFKTSAYTPDTIGVHDGAAWVINTNLQTLTRVASAR